MTPIIEPRFGASQTEMLARVLEQQGETRADIRNLRDGQERHETSMSNMGTRLEGSIAKAVEITGQRIDGMEARTGQNIELLKNKIDDVSNNVLAYRDESGRVLSEHDARLTTLEHDKSYAKGAGMTAKVVLGLAGTGVVALLGLLANWVVGKLGLL